MPRRRKYESRTGFTLVEMIVVLLILAVVTSMAVPAFSRQIDDAKEKKAVTEAQGCVTAGTGLGAQLYSKTRAAALQSVSTDANASNAVTTALANWASSVTDKGPTLTGDLALTEGQGQYYLKPGQLQGGNAAGADELKAAAGVDGTVEDFWCSGTGQIVYLRYLSADGILVAYTNNGTSGSKVVIPTPDVPDPDPEKPDQPTNKPNPPTTTPTDNPSPNPELSKKLFIHIQDGVTKSSDHFIGAKYYLAEKDNLSNRWEVTVNSDGNIVIENFLPPNSAYRPDYFVSNRSYTLIEDATPVGYQELQMCNIQVGLDISYPSEGVYIINGIAKAYAYDSLNGEYVDGNIVNVQRFPISQLKIRALDEDGKPLSGAKFTFTCDGKKPFTTSETDSDGYTSVSVRIHVAGRTIGNNILSNLGDNMEGITNYLDFGSQYTLSETTVPADQFPLQDITFNVSGTLYPNANNAWMGFGLNIANTPSFAKFDGNDFTLYLTHTKKNIQYQTVVFKVVDPTTNAPLNDYTFQLTKNADGSDPLDGTKETTNDGIISYKVNVTDDSDILNKDFTGYLYPVSIPSMKQQISPVSVKFVSTGTDGEYQLQQIYSDSATVNGMECTIYAPAVPSWTIRKLGKDGKVLTDATVVLDINGRTVSLPAITSKGEQTIALRKNSGDNIPTGMLTLNLSNSNFTLKETNAPNGYSAIPDISFRLVDSGMIYCNYDPGNFVEVNNSAHLLTVTDPEKTTCTLTILKQSDDGTPLQGAHLQLKTENGSINGNQWNQPKNKDWWTNASGACSETLEVALGCTYTLSELSAPTGYTKREDISFTVGATEYSKTVILHDHPTKEDGKGEITIDNIQFNPDNWSGKLLYDDTINFRNELLCWNGVLYYSYAQISKLPNDKAQYWINRNFDKKSGKIDDKSLDAAYDPITFLDKYLKAQASSANASDYLVVIGALRNTDSNAFDFQPGDLIYFKDKEGKDRLYVYVGASGQLSSVPQTTDEAKNSTYESNGKTKHNFYLIDAKKYTLLS